MFRSKQSGYFRQDKKRNTSVPIQKNQQDENVEEEEEKKKPKYFQKG